MSSHMEKYYEDRVLILILTCYEMIGTSNDKHISRYRKRNANTHYDVIFDVIKANDAEYSFY